MYVKKKLLDSGADIFIHLTNRLGLVDGRGVTGEIFAKYPEVKDHYMLQCERLVEMDRPTHIITQTHDDRHVVTVLATESDKDTSILDVFSAIARYLDTRPKAIVAMSQDGNVGFPSSTIDTLSDFLSDRINPRKLIITLDDEDANSNIFYM